MSLLDKFKTVTGGGWTTAGLNVQFKVIDHVLYIQCTHGLSDWLFNLFAAKVEYEEHGITVKAHAGFAALWLSIRDKIEELGFDTIVGYSEGSAIGQAVHLNYCLRKGVQPQTFLFASPRYFARKQNQNIAGKVSGIVYIKNPNDIVWHVPMLSIGFTRWAYNVIKLKKVKMPKGENIPRWLSGHSPEQYLLALQEYEK